MDVDFIHTVQYNDSLKIRPDLRAAHSGCPVTDIVRWSQYLHCKVLHCEGKQLLLFDLALHGRAWDFYLFVDEHAFPVAAPGLRLVQVSREQTEIIACQLVNWCKPLLPPESFRWSPYPSNHVDFGLEDSGRWISAGLGLAQHLRRCPSFWKMRITTCLFIMRGTKGIHKAPLHEHHQLQSVVWAIFEGIIIYNSMCKNCFYRTIFILRAKNFLCDT